MAKLSRILDQVETGTILLPEFQRGYVWNREQVRGLMRSMYRGHPVGSLLLWETTDTDLSARGGEVGGGAHLMLLDGQQRVTSLYGVLNGRAPAFFDGDDRSFTGLYFHVGEEDFAFYVRNRMAKDPMWVSVTELFEKGPFRYMRRFADMPEDEADLYLSRLNRLHQITEREFHQEKITGADKDIEEVVEIFNRVNSGGTKLSKGDLALAQVCAELPDARKVMRGAIDRWAERGYVFSLDWLLRATTAVAIGKAAFEHLDKVGSNDFRAALDRTVAHTDTFLEALSGRLGLDHDRVIKSKSSLAVAVRLLELNGGSFDDRAHRDRVLYWYMHSALWGRYTGPTESTLQKDYDTVARSGVDGLIRALERARGGSLTIGPDDFDGTQGSRFYPVLYLLVRAQRARAAHGGDLLRRQLFSTTRLRGHGGRADAIGNFFFLSGDGASLESYDDPYEFLARAEAGSPGILAAQHIPLDPGLWRVERYRDFLAARRELLAGAAQSFLDELREGRGADVDLSPVRVTAEEATDPRALQVRQMVAELREAGYADPELNTAISDPVSGEVLAEAEAFWPEGLQRGMGRPVVLELDADKADLPRLQELGYEVFTSVDSLKGSVERAERDSSGVHTAVSSVGDDPVEASAPEEGPATADFGRAMLSLYERSKSEAGYTASSFLGMLSDLGPLVTAHKLLDAPAVSDGFANLWERGRLDLTVEALVLRSEYAPLFSAEQVERAHARLAQFGYRFLEG